MKYTRHKIKMQNCVQHTLDFSPGGTTFWLKHQRVRSGVLQGRQFERGIVIVSIKFSNASSERHVSYRTAFHSRDMFPYQTAAPIGT